MIFASRSEAGEKLAKELLKYKKKSNSVILALPRGGVVLGGVIADILHLPLDIVVPRKISAPNNPEYAIGAITEDGVGIFNQDEINRLEIDNKYIKQEINTQKIEARRRLALYRGINKAETLKNKEIIIVDDGIATGLTMIAAINSVKRKLPYKIVVAVPVAARDSLEKIKTLVNEVVCIYVPSFFGAVGAFYREFNEVKDKEVQTILKNKYRYEKKF